jgi:hypothetical protein
LLSLCAELRYHFEQRHPREDIIPIAKMATARSAPKNNSEKRNRNFISIQQSPFQRCLLAQGGRQHDARCSLPPPANDVGINPMLGPSAVPCAVNPTARKRKHVSAIVIFTKQFHQFPGWRFTN